MSTEEMNLQELESQFSEQESLRREKLVKLQEEGKDPFDVYKVKRTHSSKQVKDNFEELEGKEVTVAEMNEFFLLYIHQKDLFLPLVI